MPAAHFGEPSVLLPDCFSRALYMPNRCTHDIVGTALGAVAAATRTKPEDGDACALIIVGGAFAGLVASRWPDILEPAFCPSHRQLAHSVTTGGAVLTGTVQATPQWEAHWRTVALYLRRQQLRADLSPSGQLLLTALEMLAWMLVGAIAGAATGYMSHLVLDGCTPAGLPLLGSCKSR